MCFFKVFHVIFVQVKQLQLSQNWFCFNWQIGYLKKKKKSINLLATAKANLTSWQ